MIKIDIKPLSVNGAFKGRRFKTPEYKLYQRNVLLLLPKIKVPAKPLRIVYEFGFSSSLSDFDNGVKPFTDILVKKYGFDDRDIYECTIRKVIVPKGKEYVKFEIMSMAETIFK